MHCRRCSPASETQEGEHPARVQTASLSRVLFGVARRSLPMRVSLPLERDFAAVNKRMAAVQLRLGRLHARALAAAPTPHAPFPLVLGRDVAAAAPPKRKKGKEEGEERADGVGKAAPAGPLPLAPSSLLTAPPRSDRHCELQQQRAGHSPRGRTRLPAR